MAKQKTETDETIRDDVWAALVNDVRVDETGINVDVAGGTVYLTGIVPSLFEKKTAAEIAARTRGVLDVDNELLVTPREARDDKDIAHDVRAALARDAWVDEQRIQIAVIQGIVYIKGTVVDGQSKEAASNDAWIVPGVLDVVNDLDVAPHVSRTDKDIAEELRTDLERNIRIEPRQVRVQVRDGVVYLEGSVNSIIQRWLSEDMARWIPGVVDVVNHLTIEGP